MVVNQLEDNEHASLFSSIIGDNGLGATRLLETVRVPAILTSSPDVLPTLDLEVAWDVLNDPEIEVLDVTSSMTLSGTEFHGVIIIHEATVLTLNDVIITGSIISASASLGTVPESYSEFLAPELLITGMARILADDAIPGVAILMPDGRVTAEDTLARVQIQGDVIAHSVSLLTSGSLDGNVATVDSAVIDDAIDRIGAGRLPRGWSPSLDHQSAWDVKHVAVVPTEIGLEDVTAITGFSLPGTDDEGSP
jgi:hypothetical protein